MAASNYYGYTSGAQHSQGFTQVQNPSIQTSYTAAQATTGYAVQGTAPTAAHYGPPQTQTPRQVVQPAAAYSAGSTAYAQTAPTQGSGYGYTARQQDAPPPPPPTNTSYQAAATHAGYQAHPATAQTYYDRDAYDTTKQSYYSQPQTSSVPASQGGYYAQGASATAKAAYQSTGASGYSTPVSASPAVAKSHPQAYTSSSTVAYPYSTYSTSRSHTSYNSHGNYGGSSNYGGSDAGGAGSYHPQAYEAAVYNAAAAYVQQQQQPSRPSWKNKSPGGSMGAGKMGNQQKPKLPPKQQQIHYCEICKISCAGPQTYKEHLEGQKHKKKEVASKAKPEIINSGNAYKCQLCDVTCTGADAYAAHLKGAKHQKVVNLHKKMGKPIPDIQPPKPQAPKENKEEDKNKGPGNKNNNRRHQQRRPVAPKINFIGGTKLTTTGMVKSDAAAAAAAGATSAPASTSSKDTEGDSTMDSSGDGDTEKFDLANFTGVDKSKIVGTDYLEEIKNDEGKVINFHCTLCECKFNDPNAKEAHLAGRRHRLQYKKKVQPDLVVENKPSNRRLSKGQEDKLRRQWEQEHYWRHRWQDDENRRWEEGEYYRRMEEEQFWEEEQRRRFEAECFEWERGRGGPHPPGPGGMPPHLMDGPPNIPPPRPRHDSPDDRMVMQKHSAIYPNEQELQTVQAIVSASEKALKRVSDIIADQDNPPMEVDPTEIKKEEPAAAASAGTAAASPAIKEEPKEAKPEEAGEEKVEEEVKDSKPQPPRALKGVMRVGVLAKGLLLHDKLDVNLVVLCHDKPTKTLLKRVGDLLPPQLEKVTEEKYEVKIVEEISAITICTTTDPKVTITVTLTSPVMRDTDPSPDADLQVLDRQKCLDALASLRHAKWFQAKANGLQSCVVIIRVMRELCERVPTFSPLNKWALELLVEKALSSSEHPLGPGEAFRRILECISAGILLEGGPGLNDPCEKEMVDAAVGITPQEAEDLTAAAQHALRLQAFRQLHKVLGIDPPPPPPQRRYGRFGRGGRFKRRREDSGPNDEGAKVQKKEGEGSAESMEVPAEAKDAPAKTDAKA